MLTIDHRGTVGYVVIEVGVRVQIVSPDIDAELSVSNEVHVRLRNRISFIIIVTCIVIFAWVSDAVVLLLHIDLVWRGEHALEFDHKLSDTLFSLFLLKEAIVCWSKVARQNFPLIFNMLLFDEVEDRIFLHQFFERLLSNLAFVNGGNLAHEFL